MNHIDTTYLKPATPVLHEWYSLIIDNRGNPDLVAISLYAELFAWFRNLNSVHVCYHGDDLPEIIDNRLVISYGFLTDKLNLSHERIRRAFIRLEALRLVSRNVIYTETNDGNRTRNNRLFISFNDGYFSSCFRDSSIDVRVGDVYSYYDNDKAVVSPLFHGDYIRNKSIINNRSIKSNFIDNNFFSSDVNFKENNKTSSTDWLLRKSRAVIATLTDNTSPVNSTSSIKSNSASNKNSKQRRSIKFGKPKKLESFYPLVDKDVEELQRRSGREFNKKAMNEILKDMGRKLTKPEFWSKKGFLAYMSEAFRYERRQAEQINNETFKIRANATETEKQTRIEESYLTELENNLQIGSEWHFRKKLASTLERSKAYRLLTNLRRMKLEEGGIMKLYMNSHIELSAMERQIIINQAKATHEKYENGEMKQVSSIELVFPEETARRESKKQDSKEQDYGEKKLSEKAMLETAPVADSIWGRVRQDLREKYGKDIDKAWFSRLHSEEDDEKKEIKLIAPNALFQDWIERNYMETIESIMKEQGYMVSGIET